MTFEPFHEGGCRSTLTLFFVSACLCNLHRMLARPEAEQIEWELFPELGEGIFDEDGSLGKRKPPLEHGAGPRKRQRVAANPPQHRRRPWRQTESSVRRTTDSNPRGEGPDVAPASPPPTRAPRRRRASELGPGSPDVFAWASKRPRLWSPPVASSETKRVRDDALNPETLAPKRRRINVETSEASTSRLRISRRTKPSNRDKDDPGFVVRTEALADGPDVRAAEQHREDGNAAWLRGDQDVGPYPQPSIRATELLVSWPFGATTRRLLSTRRPRYWHCPIQASQQRWPTRRPF